MDFLEKEYIVKYILGNNEIEQNGVLLVASNPWFMKHFTKMKFESLVDELINDNIIIQTRRSYYTCIDSNFSFEDAVRKRFNKGRFVLFDITNS